MYTEESVLQSAVPLLVSLPLILISAAIIVFIMIAVRRNFKANPKEHAGDSSIEATVLQKRSRKRRDPNTLYYDKEYAYGPTVFYYITFETKNFQHIELTVSSEIFRRLSEGDIGQLFYQGSQFIDFIPGHF